MDAGIIEWLNLGLRWFHVFVGILWIGSTYYFTWLDHRMTEALAENAGTDKHPTVWMVHSGGFYVVEKRKIPEVIDSKLHWFRFEALFTWISGLLLLTVVYYMGAILMDTGKTSLSHGTGVAIGITVVMGSWLVYDLLWNSSLGKNKPLAATISYLLIVATAFGLSQIFSGRAMYIHIGAIFGTLMASNVWMRILPAQTRMLKNIKVGLPPDQTLGERAKARSLHNTYMVVPLVFIMISNHYPISTYGAENNWLVLAVLLLVGGVAAKIIYHTKH